jgi:hypothetical protein
MFKTFATSVAVGFASLMLIQPASAGSLMNGQESNGVRKNGLILNGQESNGAKMNGVKINGQAGNGAKLNGLKKNGQEQNGRDWQGSATGTPAFAIDGIELPAATR